VFGFLGKCQLLWRAASQSGESAFLSLVSSSIAYKAISDEAGRYFEILIFWEKYSKIA